MHNVSGVLSRRHMGRARRRYVERRHMPKHRPGANSSIPPISLKRTRNIKAILFFSKLHPKQKAYIMYVAAKNEHN